MAQDIRVFSTMATDISYVEYRAGPQGGVPSIARSVTIKGGAHVPTKHLVTPRGVVTKVSAEDLDFLVNNREFKLHLASGFMKFESRNVELEDAVADMNPKDSLRPLTAKDYELGGRAAARSSDGKTLIKPPAARA